MVETYLDIKSLGSSWNNVSLTQIKKLLEYHFSCGVERYQLAKSSFLVCSKGNDGLQTYFIGNEREVGIGCHRDMVRKDLRLRYKKSKWVGVSKQGEGGSYLVLI